MESMLVSSRGRKVIFLCGEEYFEGSRTVPSTWKPFSANSSARKWLSHVSRENAPLGVDIPNASWRTTCDQRELLPLLLSHCDYSDLVECCLAVLSPQLLSSRRLATEAWP